MQEDHQNQAEIDKSPKNAVAGGSRMPFKTKNILYIVLLGCITGVVFFVHSTEGFGIFKNYTTHSDKKIINNESIEGSEMICNSNYFLSLPEIVVNLRVNKQKNNVLRTSLFLQLYDKKEEQKIKEFMPLIIDQILSYLRDQSIADLEGPGLERMRQAILLRVNNTIKPFKVYRVVIKDFIIQ